MLARGCRRRGSRVWNLEEGAIGPSFPIPTPRPIPNPNPACLPVQICDEALGKARRQGYVLGVGGQPADHPYPAAADELRYLKFVTFRLEN